MKPALPCNVVLLTPPGRGAVATLLVAGERADEHIEQHFQAAANKPLRDFSVGRIVFGRWRSSASSDGEEVVVCRLGDRQFEIHCHGGVAASQAIVDSLVSAGCRYWHWRDWIALPPIDRIAVDLEIALREAPTTRTAALLLAQRDGRLRSELSDIVTLFETDVIDAALKRLNVLRQFSNFGQHLTKPWRVVLGGRPNVGKSSLMNAILGYARAIVFDQPGTTRDIVTATTAIDGWPVELSDTAGLRATSEAVEAEGVSRARLAAAAADLLVLVFDATQPWSADERALVDEYPQSIVVFNKCDLPNSNVPHPDALRTSAATGDRVEKLISTIAQRLVPQLPQPWDAVPFTDEQAAAIEGAYTLALNGDKAAAARHLRGLLE